MNYKSEYTSYLPRWKRAADVTLGGQDVVRAAGKTYLDPTSGMDNNWHSGGQAHYERYKSRARLPDIAADSLSGAMGILFTEPPEGNIDEIVGASGQSLFELSREVCRQIYTKGRHILLVDSEKGSSDFRISQYSAERLVDWKVDSFNKRKLTSVTLSEGEIDDKEIFRRYEIRDSSVDIFIIDEDENIIDQIGMLSAISEIPIVIQGSIDISPEIDPIPVEPIVLAALAYYRNSADHEQLLHSVAQPTAWVKTDEYLYENILNMGLGVGALLNLGLVPESACGFLEMSGAGEEALRAKKDHELKQAESYAMKLTQDSGGGVESYKSIQLRAAMQKATISGIADSVSMGINKCLEFMAILSNSRQIEEFRINPMMDQTQAEATMLGAINTAVMAGNMPRSLLLEYAEKTKMTSKTVEQLQEEIDTGMSA
jgi:predicted transcriptional regulator